MNLRIAIALTVLVATTGCAYEPPIYARLGTTATCLKKAYELPPPSPPDFIDLRQQAINECMWKKAQGKKD